MNALILLVSVECLYAFHLGQIISPFLGQVDHGDQHGNAAEPESGTKGSKLTTLKNDA